MRGKEAPALRALPAHRITPAYAGKRRCPRFRPGKIRDHPRMCGEKAKADKGTMLRIGSPPHVRGKASAIFWTSFMLRITPACAGKRSHELSNDDLYWDHPRTCGEKRIAQSDELAVEGSPPRMRGKERQHVELLPLFRITPAYAGKRACMTTATTQPRDHPRMCGEKKAEDIFETNFVGSPPHVRGKD